jgi:secreted trypsin-like serine protease
MNFKRSFISSAILGVILGYVLTGCRKDDGDGDSSLSAGSACTDIGFTKSIKVANGEQCLADGGGDTSSVVKLKITSAVGLGGTCTGTVISPTAILTAAHCFQFGIQVSVLITAVSNGQKIDIPASRIATHPSFSNAGRGLLVNDVAVIRTSAQLPVPALPILLSRPARVDEEAVLAGYGQTDNGGGAVDDVVAGRAVIRSVTDDHVRIDYKGDESHPCKGDSGGALFVEQNGELAIVGVVSQSDPSINADQVCKKGDKTLYTNTQGREVSDFIFSIARDAAVK